MMKVEIEIPDPPEGWVYDGLRETKECDLVWTGSEWKTPPALCYMYHVAVKANPLWTPSPELVAVLKPGWIARDPSGYCWWHEQKPLLKSSQWKSCGCISETNGFKEVYLPPLTIPWDKCCFRIGGDE
jgi:hypothetical protein